MGDHCRKPWWRDVDFTLMRTEWFSNAKEASVAEKSAIYNELPLHNKSGKPGQHSTTYSPAEYTRVSYAHLTTPELKALIEEQERIVALDDEWWAERGVGPLFKRK